MNGGLNDVMCAGTKAAGSAVRGSRARSGDTPKQPAQVRAASCRWVPPAPSRAPANPRTPVLST